MSRQQGFTLIEMLVALAIFGVIAAASAALLGGAVAGREAVARADGRLDELALARAILKADLAQIAPGRGRIGSGEARPWSFLGRDPGGAGDEPVLAFVRRGWSNPGAAEARGELLAVEYRLEDDRLERIARHRPDAVADTPVSRRVLLAGVESARLRFLGPDGQWRPEWRVPAHGGAPPRAVELAVELGGLGKVRQVFRAGGG